MIQMRMHRRYHQVMVRVLKPRQSFGQLALVMIVDVGQTCDAAPLVVAPLLRVLQVCPKDIAHRLATSRIAALTYKLVESVRQLFV
jgi:hypothetical protein